ncbi:MAG: threonine/serine exporter family protein [Candidatus Azobacteroides sp.]|nr:threonine/serine exporter family protein [Candidatus Azobacteroides sp.]
MKQELADGDSDLGRKLDLMLRTGKLLIQSLADSNRIDRNMRRIAVYMGIPSDQFHMHITYTTLMININEGSRSVTKFRKCTMHSVNMTMLSEISKLSWRAIEKEYTLDEYERELDRIEKAKHHYPRWLTVIGIGLACAGFCKLFGCDWPAAFITAVASSIAMLARQEMTKRHFNLYMTIAISAFIAVIIAGLGVYLKISDTPHHPIFACVLFLIPGVPLINCVDDMIDGFTIVGVTRAVIASFTIGAITFGMALALNVLHLNDYSAMLGTPGKWFMMAVAAAVAAMGFAILFNVPPHTLIVAAAGGAVTVVLRNFLMYQAGWSLPLSSFCGAFFFGMITLYLVHVVHVPAHVISIPPVIPMIPGVLMYRAMVGLLNIDATEGLEQIPFLLQALESGVKACMTILGISLGVALSNVIGRRYFSTSKQKRLMMEIKMKNDPIF